MRISLDDKVMKTNFVKNYKKLLVVWIAIGVFVSGIFLIFPKTGSRIFPENEREKMREFDHGPQYNNVTCFEFTLLVTVVGSILIGGLGYTSKPKD